MPKSVMVNIDQMNKMIGVLHVIKMMAEIWSTPLPYEPKDKNNVSPYDMAKMMHNQTKKALGEELLKELSKLEE